jgi:transcriptional regulator with XRE-family HTH domain
MPTRDEAGLFPAILRHWRSRRGLSQLDLALAADVSPRHVSFLETGRAQPSREMVLRLGATLDVPLRDQNALLDAAGFAREFAEPSFADGLPDAISRTIDRMLAQQEPFPMVAMNRRYDVLRTNQAAARLLSTMIAQPEAVVAPINMMRALFDPRLGRPYVIEWERVARALLSRLHREALGRPGDSELASLVHGLLEYPDVPESFRQPDFSQPSEPILTIRLRAGDLDLAFLTTVTVFNAPQNVTLEEVRLESYFPLDEATTRACEQLAQTG